MKISNLSYFAFGTLLSSVMSFITLPAVAWLFSPSDIGRLNVLNTLVAFTTLLLVLGLDQAYVREYHESKQRAALFRFCIIPGIILYALISTVAFFYSDNLILFLFELNDHRLYWLTVGFVGFSFFSRFFSLVLRLEERGFAYSVSQVIPKIIFIFILYIFYLLGVESEFYLLIAANFIALVVVICVMSYNLKSHIADVLSSSIFQINFKDIFLYAAPLVPASIIYWGMTAINTVFLKMYCGLSELGIYSMAVSVSSVAVVFQMIFTTVWMPTVYKWSAQGVNLDRIDHSIRHIFALVSLVYILVGSFSFLIDFVIPPEYVSVKYLVASCISQPLLYMLSETTVVGVNINRKSYGVLFSSVVGFASHFIFSWYFIPKFGAAGAVVATSFGYFVFLVSRTELSVWFWRPIKRTKIYIVISFILIIASISSLFHELIYFPFAFIWLTILIPALFIFRDSLVFLYGESRKILGSKN